MTEYEPYKPPLLRVALSRPVVDLYWAVTAALGLYYLYLYAFGWVVTTWFRSLAAQSTHLYARIALNTMCIIALSLSIAGVAYWWVRIARIAQERRARRFALDQLHLTRGVPR